MTTTVRDNARRQGLPGEVVQYYIDTLASDPDALRGSFAAYRALDATIAQNQGRTAGG